MAGLNGNGVAVRKTVKLLPTLAGESGRGEVVVRGFYVALLRRHESRHLIVGRADRRVSAEEALEIADAVGAPVGSEPRVGRKWFVAGDLPARRIETLEFSWREE